MSAKHLFATMVFAVPGIALAQDPSTTTKPPAEPVIVSVPAVPVPVPVPVPVSDASFRNTLPVTVRSPGANLEGGDVLTSRPPKVGGALARAARARQPWQVINPFAPLEFGQGYENVTEDPHTHQPTGIVLVSFGSGRRH